MPREDLRSGFGDVIDPAGDLPFDSDLELLDAELAAAGEQARRMLYGRTQPTRVFTNHLRQRLMAPVLPAVNVGSSGSVVATSPALHEDLDARRSIAISSEWPGERRTVGAEDRQSRAISSRAALAVLAFLGFFGLLAMGALGGSFGPPLP